MPSEYRNILWFIGAGLAGILLLSACADDPEASVRGGAAAAAAGAPSGEAESVPPRRPPRRYNTGGFTGYGGANGANVDFLRARRPKATAFGDD